MTDQDEMPLKNKLWLFNSFVNIYGANVLGSNTSFLHQYPVRGHIRVWFKLAVTFLSLCFINLKGGGINQQILTVVFKVRTSLVVRTCVRTFYNKICSNHKSTNFTTNCKNSIIINYFDRKVIIAFLISGTWSILLSVAAITI